MAEKDGAPLSLQVVIPVYNEALVLKPLFHVLEEVFSVNALQDHGLSSYQVIFVDDGSLDSTAEIIATEIEKGAPYLLLRLTRNFGHQSAIQAGLDKANADLVAIVDADLQNPIECVLGMIRKMREGFHVVYGQSVRNNETWFKFLQGWLFYRTLRLLSETDIPMDSADFCVMRIGVVRAIGSLRESSRFIRGVRSWVGFRQAAFKYKKARRAGGRSKYGFRKLFCLARDGIVSSGTRPLYFALLVSLLFSVMTVVFFFSNWLTPASNGTPLFVLFSLACSLEFLCLFILGIYVERIYFEVKRRPAYLILE